jgi:DNA-binding IclR family transcriptional regulator
VLEDMAADAERDGSGRLVVVTNVRQLASNLGLSKDTVARALGRLVDAGLVARPSAGRTQGGTFGPGVYVLAAERLAGLLPADLTDHRHRSTTTRRQQRQTPRPSQDSLFDFGTSR